MDYKFVGAFIVMRHGARNPLKKEDEFYKILYNNWGNHDSNITDIGIQQSKLSGEYLARYYKLQNFKGEIVYSNSGLQRTIDTQKNFLIGWEKIFKKNTIEKHLNNEKNIYYRNYSSEYSKKYIKKEEFIKSDKIKKFKIGEKLNIVRSIDKIVKNYCKCEYIVNDNNIDDILIQIATAYDHNKSSPDKELPLKLTNEQIQLSKIMLQNYLNMFYSRSDIVSLGIGKLP